ncbi:DeoR family transcriptional regulator [Cohnella sp. CIP 111063]|uniref:DeoR/GlpR family DNA-binding transcription regulator n=1 Tax=unclassified Cohnella TaxID=2636738 RepID=UPI000B8BF0AD|nr:MULTISPECIES: DeoR/GlpR family DNA-binding transcription regulator [unclassified Cohnella]OXS52943.1 DeoR family transcriptional regulator [Cohnella sp. CIP 111063]PRX60198.1 DeoR family transcriptional regulator [Cohnella sp. SGD-V74]
MSLIGEERKAIILDQLNMEGQVKTFELVKKLGVSSETIRRYLEELEEENRLKRVYGGAVKINLSAEEPSYLKREVLHAEEKQRIGRAAASLVEDNDVVFIDDGTTPLQMIQFLMNKSNLTVLTMSLPALHQLVEYKNRDLFSGDIYLIGGKVNAMHSRVTGPIAEKIVSLFHADKAFISIDGIVLNKGITSFDAERGQLVSRVIENAKQTIVMTDSSKIGLTQLYLMAGWRDVDIVISDVSVPKGWRQTLDEMGVDWIWAQ